ncbi:hypothetical protein OIU77_011157 [Salix suchowensis]|uniref:RNA-binding S4 domain-containing protein n=1 Tax=Salix suchowensis TaxID=1278906 RepID=A0ABQ9ABS9_9ROSI|nr:hypothetical protein OIU77_011157 [Salix suchowensis]
MAQYLKLPIIFSRSAFSTKKFKLDFSYPNPTTVTTTTLLIFLQLEGSNQKCNVVQLEALLLLLLRQESFNYLKKKRRLDEICLERFQQYSRTFIQSWILQGKVFVDGKVVNKAGTPVSEKSVVEIIAEVPKYVCRAGYKLEAAIEQLDVDVAGKVALDSGLSTGGFTDCLLQNGASFVYGVDVGYGQVADKIRRDERVCVIERTNLRYLSELPQKVDLVTLDLSFISILLVMPAVVNVMKEEATLVTLVKPQFEARRSQVGSGGIVRDSQVHQEVLEKITKGVEGFGFRSNGWIESPLKGAEGNIEFLVRFSRIHEIVQNDGH